jgi:anaerobic selenocysteine-containing dehydrogenase
MSDEERFESDTHPAGGWGSVKEVVTAFAREHVLPHHNKPDGYACVSCSWAKPAHPHTIEACESGIKATGWEITRKRTTPEFFSKHTLTELESWSDLDLEAHGRLTAPLRWDPASDKYVEVAWEDAFADIGAKLKALDPKSVVFYASGRASLETFYMYKLFVRMYGCNNLPDSSNMCHESTSVGLQESLGVGVGTVSLEDFEHTDCIFFFGQNVGTNSPRRNPSRSGCRKRAERRRSAVHDGNQRRKYARLARGVSGVLDDLQRGSRPRRMQRPCRCRGTQQIVLSLHHGAWDVTDAVSPLQQQVVRHESVRPHVVDFQPGEPHGLG